MPDDSKGAFNPEFPFSREWLERWHQDAHARMEKEACTLQALERQVAEYKAEQEREALMEYFPTDLGKLPGEVLREYLAEQNIALVDLANGTGLGWSRLQNILAGREPIANESATRLEKYLSVRASYWLELQEAWDAKKRDARLIEALAAYAHEAWAGWMKYMFSKMADEHFQPQAIVYNKKTRVALPECSIWGDEAQAHIDRWKRQMTTHYALLPEQEKESDRAEARKILEIIRKETNK